MLSRNSGSIIEFDDDSVCGCNEWDASVDGDCLVLIITSSGKTCSLTSPPIFCL